MIKESLFPAEEREAKLDKVGDVLQLMEKYVVFKALAAVPDRADGADVATALQPQRRADGIPTA